MLSLVTSLGMFASLAGLALVGLNVGLFGPLTLGCGLGMLLIVGICRCRP